MIYLISSPKQSASPLTWARPVHNFRIDSRESIRHDPSSWSLEQVLFFVFPVLIDARFNHNSNIHIPAKDCISSTHIQTILQLLIIQVTIMLRQIAKHAKLTTLLTKGRQISGEYVRICAANSSLFPSGMV